jgi:hypothetical protein
VIINCDVIGKNHMIVKFSFEISVLLRIAYFAV